jgi:hypothetical protein
MLTSTMAAFTAAMAMASLASATCLIPNDLKPDAPKETWPESVCAPQADCNYHLSYSSSSLCLPTFSGGVALAGCSGSDGFGALWDMMQHLRITQSLSLSRHAICFHAHLLSFSARVDRYQPLFAKLVFRAVFLVHSSLECFSTR